MVDLCIAWVGVCEGMFSVCVSCVVCILSGRRVDMGPSDVWLLPTYSGVSLWATGLQEGCCEQGENPTLEICVVK